MSRNSQTNQLLGYPADARLLIINADDFGMCHAVNAAIAGVLQEGVVRSTTLMVSAFLDSYLLGAGDKVSRYSELLRRLPAGLSERAVHPGLDNRELQAIDPGGSHMRQVDFDFFASPKAKKTIAEEGIILLDYRDLQDVWNDR